mmetsp:Transcript_55600/g.146698  ORF Transcript_55600/g.146698 Transcript_55600/m.146698 type:complete len:346 (-) Transcript_55600:202-1239(-)
MGYGWEAQDSKSAFFDNSSETAKCDRVNSSFQNKWAEDKVGGAGKAWDEENHSEASTVTSPCPESSPVWNVESGVRQGQAPAVSVDKKAVVVDRNLETGSPYRRHTSELLRRIDILLVQNSPPSNGSNGKRKKSRASSGVNKPRARNVVLKQLVDLLRKIQRDDQATSFVTAEAKSLMGGFRSAARHSTSSFDNSSSLVRPRDAADVMRCGVRDVARPPINGLSAPPPAAPPPCDVKLPPSAMADGWMGWNWSHHSEPAGFVGAEAGPAGPTGPAMPATFWAGHSCAGSSAGVHGPAAEEDEEVAGAEVLDLLALLRGGAAGGYSSAAMHQFQQQVAAGCFQHWE